ncbi:Oidioi.mRNA.OKI2018_I69.chr2.g8014.t1.cds [Oikopleura dioica]|uniref:Oidioi.mRNA.OKI2018_I69.chr2.g8014.t1.cds n=1 Tax=Oikopleura dioica TaxID=34765 RepID=A0ABN7T8I4_OIKDI|nr:Oidioi.mRNA.OKI2018_I69.chr2.g8014.t1.cds [Oikopleura dioica]
MSYSDMQDLHRLVDDVIAKSEDANLLNFQESAFHFLALKENKLNHPGIYRDKNKRELYMKITPELMQNFLIAQKSDWANPQIARGIASMVDDFEESGLTQARSAMRASLIAPSSKKSPNSSPNTSDAPSSPASSSDNGATVINPSAALKKFSNPGSKSSSHVSNPVLDYEDQIADYNSEQDLELDDADLHIEELAEQVQKRMKIKSWLFSLARLYKNHKDGGIRFQELNDQCYKVYGIATFDELVQNLGYRNGEDAMLHIGHPQLKICKHKTTGKGVTKDGEWVIMEEEKYPGKNLDVDTLPEEELLSDLGKNDRLEICWTSSRFRKPDNWTPNLAKKKATLPGVAMSMKINLFWTPFAMNFRNSTDRTVHKILLSKNGSYYRLQPGCLRMGLPIVVWNKNYNEWCRAHCVTPTANDKDLTICYTDYGESDQVKVHDCFFLHESFTKYPELSRTCKLYGEKQNYFSQTQLKEKTSWEFFHCKNDGATQATFDGDKKALTFSQFKINFSFVEMGDKDAIAFVIPYHPVLKSQWDSRNFLTLQEEMIHKKLIKANVVQLQLAIRGNLQDSVSNLPGTKPPTRRQRGTRPKITGPNMTAPRANQATVRAEGEPITSKNGVSNFTPATSAKEKTGADPLAQSTIPLDSVKDAEELPIMGFDENVPRARNPKMNWTAAQRERSKTAGPAEALTRGTLQPPSQNAPANIKHPAQRLAESTNGSFPNPFMFD